MIQPSAASVVLRVTVLARPNHPLRLVAIFAMSIAASVIIATGAYVLTWLVQDMRGAHDTATVVAPVPNLTAPEGMVIVQPAKDAREFERLTNFAPFVPRELPEHTLPAPSFAATLPDSEGRRAGRVAFSAAEGVDVDGVSGPLVVLIEAEGAPGAGVDGVLKQSTTVSRLLLATLACRGLVIDVQMYFSPEAAAGEPAVTPYMRETAERFLASLHAECGG